MEKEEDEMQFRWTRRKSVANQTGYAGQPFFRPIFPTSQIYETRDQPV